ncbi:hypothetical protein AAFF_G00127280 [Aldrovandia affinis]|uniref:Uncharacterized protein n=1 Tax=Aldrovandia affinis TaxID=143900 RepID=A0AAD7WX30_9TELE|nr:hypothetical protein AAFF_G00127280 [Aldrovandia affinis]
MTPANLIDEASTIVRVSAERGFLKHKLGQNPTPWPLTQPRIRTMYSTSSKGRGLTCCSCWCSALRTQPAHCTAPPAVTQVQLRGGPLHRTIKTLRPTATSRATALHLPTAVTPHGLAPPCRTAPVAQASNPPTPFPITEYLLMAMDYHLPGCQCQIHQQTAGAVEKLSVGVEPLQASQPPLRVGTQAPGGPGVPEPEVEGGPEVDYLRRLQERLKVVHNFTRQAQPARCHI